MFFKNLEKEINNSPALMIIIWILYSALILSTFTGFIDLCFLIISIILIGLNIRNYRRKY